MAKLKSTEEKGQEYFYKILLALNEMLNNEESEFYIDINEVIKEDGLSEFFHALGNIAPLYIYQKITNNDKSALGFNHLMNELIVQNIVKENTKNG